MDKEGGMEAEGALQQLSKAGHVFGVGMDFWSALCILCHGEGVATEVDLRRVARQFERDFKRPTRATSMPGRYRSAKSVLNKALGLNVAYVTERGTPRPKTVVFDDCG
jgi:hypothetical protein